MLTIANVMICDLSERVKSGNHCACVNYAKDILDDDRLAIGHDKKNNKNPTHGQGSESEDGENHSPNKKASVSASHSRAD